MYTLKQKKVISRRIADISYIERYRQLLKNVRSPAAGRKMLDRQQLADYLCVERAAMSVELSKLQKEGLLKTRRNHFELCEVLKSGKI